MLIAAKNKTHIQKLKAQLKKEFNMKDLGEVKKISGMEITQNKGSIRFWLSQENYILKVLKWFNMAEARPITTLLAGYFKLFFKQYPQSPEEEEEYLEYHMLVGWEHSCILRSALGLT